MGSKNSIGAGMTRLALEQVPAVAVLTHLRDFEVTNYRTVVYRDAC